MKKISCIYKITCLGNNIIYIGSTNSLKQRKIKHLATLRSGKHHNPRMQNCFNKYGEKSFVFEIIQLVENVDDLVILEQYYIDLYQASKYEIGFNMCPVAGSTQGRVVSEETRRNQSLRTKGRPGKPTSEETKEKQRQAKLKNPTRYWTGKKHSEETKKKISDNNRKLITTILIDVNGNEISVTNLTKFARENKLDPSNLWSVFSGKAKTYKGYKLKK